VLPKNSYSKEEYMNINPLKQYFRRPAVYMKLPSGGKDYTSDVIDFPINGEFPVYPMTAIDEISAKTPDALFNCTAVTDLIKSCMPNIKDPWSIKSTDLDAILISIRSASSGDSLDIESTCPACTETSTFAVSLVGLLTTLKPNDYSKVLEVGELKLKFKPLTYKELNEIALSQFEIQRTYAKIEAIENDDERLTANKKSLEQVTILTMEVVGKTLEYIETPSLRVQEPGFIFDFLKNCDKNMFSTIKDYNSELKKDSDLKPLDVKCPNCSHEYKQVFTLNSSDFFG